MRKPEGEREYLAAARDKYTAAMTGVILRLLGIRWDLEEDMRELAKEYEDHFPLTALLLYAQPAKDKSPRGLYWAWRARAIYVTLKDGRVGRIEKARSDNISGAWLITRIGRWRVRPIVSRAGRRPSTGMATPRRPEWPIRPA